MPDILYPLSVCGPFVALVKRDFHLVAYNESGQDLSPLAAFEEIGYSETDGINRLKTCTLFPEGKFAPQKRSAEGRDLREVQDNQLALELERYLHGVQRAFPISEMSPAWYPLRMLADILRHRADHLLPEIDIVQLTASLVTHADHLMRANLADSELPLTAINLTVNADTANPSIPSGRLAIDFFEQSLNAYTAAHVEMVNNRVAELVAG
jgi:hypothetical protein